MCRPSSPKPSAAKGWTFVAAMKHGLGLGKVLGTIHAYPTMAEANKYAAGEWKKANQPERLLKWV